MTYWKNEEIEVELNNIVDGDAEEIYLQCLKKKSLSTKQEIKSYLDVLFNGDEHICLWHSPSNYSFISKRSYCGQLGKLLSFHPSNPNTTTRRNSDVTKLRTFLIEFDNISIRDQYEGILKLNFPYSIITYSGNKSLHILLTLEQEICDLQAYSYYARWIHNILKNKMAPPDPLTKSPSFLTRFPNVTADNGFSSQKVLSISDRIKNEVFLNWLNQYQEYQPRIQKTHDNETLIKDRENIISLVDWYVLEHLKSHYTESDNWFMCPLCKSEGKEHYGKRMIVKGVNRYVSCIADSDHNLLLLKKMWDLKKTGGNNNE